jgi:hypothetical protein
MGMGLVKFVILIVFWMILKIKMNAVLICIMDAVVSFFVLHVFKLT